ncbi:MAG: DUF4365 domain-containing protein, partial [Victivallaceae bacterium]|nr:DUF4365 domain-containing protein [Victivallaceae bacterium]
MKINEKIQLSKLGVNLVRSIVDHNNCFFHDIKQESDLGIDAIIEFLYNGETTGKSIAVQIKTGESYCDTNKKRCVFPIENHESYWLSYELPVYGFVCDLNNQCFYYVNISEYLRNERCEKNTISFKIEFYNTINSNNFSNLFLGLLLRKTPYLDFTEARKLALSDSKKDSSLGLFILRKHHYKISSTWSVFSSIFKKEYIFDSSIIVLEFLSVGTHNPDV